MTWDIPGKFDECAGRPTSIEELGAIVEQTTADAAVKGVVITSGKEAFSAGADLSMLEGMNRTFAEMLKAKGDEAAQQMLFDESRKLSQTLRESKPRASPGSPRSTGLRLAAHSN